mmetsp:Transcript_17156/g.58245  ORF Transcript_17156/g.58245 Transcript_17156/m.58245 type:complete len:421 (-) Transcript_17156:96-1358(-)
MEPFLCGDEVAGIVADVGSTCTKMGFVGADSPTAILTEVGRTADGRMVTSLPELRFPRPGLDVVRPLDGSGGVNWDEVQALLEAGVRRVLRATPEEHPLLLAESGFTTHESHVELLKLSLESLGHPAVYLARSAVLSAFCHGKQTALVVDCGASACRVSPVVDGYQLTRSCTSSPRGGDWLEGRLLELLQQRGVGVEPRYGGHAAELRDSYRSWSVRGVVRDLKHCVCRVPEEPLDDAGREGFLEEIPERVYELPDGTRVDVAPELYSAADALFDASQAPSAPTAAEDADAGPRKRPRQDAGLPGQPPAAGNAPLALQELVYQAACRSDVDARKELLASVCLCGGTSLIPGLPARLSHELRAMLPSGFRPKLHTMLPVEREFSAFIGGSILASCGAFQQLWIGRAQYLEEGERVLQRLRW